MTSFLLRTQTHDGTWLAPRVLSKSMLIMTLQAAYTTAAENGWPEPVTEIHTFNHASPRYFPVSVVLDVADLAGHVADLAGNTYQLESATVKGSFDVKVSRNVPL
jgi:hypothetical protein